MARIEILLASLLVVSFLLFAGCSGASSPTASAPTPAISPSSNPAGQPTPLTGLPNTAPTAKLLQLLKLQQSTPWTILLSSNVSPQGFQIYAPPAYTAISFKSPNVFSFAFSNSSSPTPYGRTYVINGSEFACQSSKCHNTGNWTAVYMFKQTVIQEAFFLDSKAVNDIPAGMIEQLPDQSIAGVAAHCFNVPFGFVGYNSDPAQYWRQSNFKDQETYCFSDIGVPLRRQIIVNNQLIADTGAIAYSTSPNEGDFQLPAPVDASSSTN